MPETYEVEPGDCMSSIAFSHGFFWETLWNDASNAELKARRKNPNVLMTGDVVQIPDLTVKQEPGATETRHKFMLKGVPEKLRMRFLDANHKPRANVEYVLEIDGDSRRGRTDSNGELVESIPPDAKAGKLMLGGAGDKPVAGKSGPQVVRLKLGHLDPVSEVSGLKARLANLGYYQGPIDDQMDGNTRQAIRAFQTKKGLPATGEADDATKAKLEQLHGH